MKKLSVIQMLAVALMLIISGCTKEPITNMMPSEKAVKGGSAEATMNDVLPITPIVPMITARGILLRAPNATYEYGTFILAGAGNAVICALRSSTVDMEKFIKKNVEVGGYAISNNAADAAGTPYMEVTWIDELTSINEGYTPVIKISN